MAGCNHVGRRGWWFAKHFSRWISLNYSSDYRACLFARLNSSFSFNCLVVRPRYFYILFYWLYSPNSRESLESTRLRLSSAQVLWVGASSTLDALALSFLLCRVYFKLQLSRNPNLIFDFLNYRFHSKASFNVKEPKMIGWWTRESWNLSNLRVT